MDVNRILGAGGVTIFTTMSALAAELGAVNLGQGFPDADGPLAIRQAAAEALLNHSNQYPPMRGTLALRQAVARHEARYYGRAVDPERGIIATSGATEALAACLFGLLNPGDEVIAFEPLYDSYVPIIRRAGAVPKLIRLEPPTWSVPWAALEAAFTPATKVVLLNTPMNPCAKVWTHADLARLAALCVQHDVAVIADEVYEHLVFGPLQHISIATLPGMAERTLKLGSAGKIFSLTGWKVGFVSGPAALMDAVAGAHQFLTFTTPPNLQAAVAFGLDTLQQDYLGLAVQLQPKRDALATRLAALGFDPLPCAGTYFLVADYGRFSEADDLSFAKQLVHEAGVATIPLSPFYAGAAPDHRLIRFCFIKQDAVLQEGLDRLTAWAARQ
jgi:N-succinyldiaminopimelate aminotransferase